MRQNPWTDQARRRKEEWLRARGEALRAAGETPMTQGQLIGVLNDWARPGDTVVAAAGGPPGDLLKVWDATGERRCHLEFGYSCMGYEIPAALGVRLARPQGEVVACIGDGTFLMQPTELATAVQEGLKIAVVVSDNHGFQVIRRLQMLRSGRHFGNELRHRVGALGEGALDGEYLRLDLTAIARGLGATACTASSPEELRAALDRVRETPGPMVVVVPTAPHENLPGSGAWWDVAPAEVSNQPWVAEKRREYDTDRARQRWFG